MNIEEPLNFQVIPPNQQPETNMQLNRAESLVHNLQI